MEISKNQGLDTSVPSACQSPLSISPFLLRPEMLTIGSIWDAILKQSFLLMGIPKAQDLDTAVPSAWQSSLSISPFLLRPEMLTIGSI